MLYFYHPDHLGSTGFVTDRNGEVYQHIQYFPFGETWTQEATNTQRTPYLFTSKELDDETGYYYFGARYYDPRASIWISPDPILDEYLPLESKITESLKSVETEFLPARFMWDPKQELVAVELTILLF